MSKFYDKEGNEISLLEWGNLFENKEYKRVSSTHLKNGIWVSTIWLGMDHNYFGEGENGIKIFESMAFSPGKLGELDCVRYSNLKEAINGHVKMCQKLENHEHRPND